MNLAQFNSAPNAPALPPNIDPADPNGIDRYMLSLMQHCSTVEDRVNAALDASDRTNVYSWGIDESAVFRGNVRLPIRVSALEPA